MEKMTIAKIGLTLNPEKEVDEIEINLPENTRINFVEVKKTKDILWVQIMYPLSESTISYKKFKFIVCTENFINTYSKEYLFVGNIVIDQCTYYVFYQTEAI